VIPICRADIVPSVNAITPSGRPGVKKNVCAAVMAPRPTEAPSAAFHLNILTDMARDMGLTALAEEKFPRVVDRAEPDKGYYIAMGLVMGVWMITPLSW
jgi:hypothetical protein